MPARRSPPSSVHVLPALYLFLPMEYAYTRDVMRGIRQYARADRQRRLVLIAPTAENLRGIRSSGAASINGIIGFFANVEAEKQLASLHVPKINVSEASENTTLPRVVPDNYAAGQLAGEHLLERGFRHFAFFGYAGHAYSIHRRDGFIAAIRKFGLTEPCHEPPSARISTWLRKLHRPLGVLACNDQLARTVVEAAQQAGLKVPDDVGVVGVDNDDVQCEMAEVPLSSVYTNGRRVGFEAASLLDRMLAGEKPPRDSIRVPPGGVVARESSDVLAVGDPDMAAALRYIHAHAGEPIHVYQILDYVGISRSTLEKRFRELFGRTPHDAIRRARFDRAKQLLSDTDLKIPVVAQRCGYKDAKRFTREFHAALGLAPVAYRGQFRVH